jgi:hypothetical protein
LIDPNPEIGFSQPLYDIGKLLHWVEPVGWAQVTPQACEAEWHARVGRGRWSLNAWVEGVSRAAEQRRKYIEERVNELANAYRGGYGVRFTPMLALARASAHVGLAALLTGRSNLSVRRFVLAHALRALMACSDG